MRSSRRDTWQAVLRSVTGLTICAGLTALPVATTGAAAGAATVNLLLDFVPLQASPATVTVYAWPIDEPLRIGQRLPQTRVAEADDVEGDTASLPVQVGTLAPDITAAGCVNLEIVAVAGRGQYGSYFEPWCGLRSRDGVVTASAPISSADVAMHQVRTSERISNANECQPYVMNTWLVKNMPLSETQLATLFNGDDNATDEFTFKSGQYTNSTVGVSGSTQYGSFSADGSTDTSVSTTVGPISVTYGDLYLHPTWETAYNTGLFETCNGGFFPGYLISYSIRQYSWYGTDPVAYPHMNDYPTPHGCATFGAGTPLTLDKSTDESWTVAAGLGFTASTTTGYSSGTVMYLKMNDVEKVCATNTSGLSSPGSWITEFAS